MSKIQMILPFAVFSAIMSVMALGDFVFMLSSFLYTHTDLIWRYPSDSATLLGALWFGQVCAALLTPVVLRYGFRIRQRMILMPWLLLGGLIGIHTVYWAWDFINSSYDSIEVVWRTLHMPMTSRQTMTFQTNGDFLASFVFIQATIAAILFVSYAVSFGFFHTRYSKK